MGKCLNNITWELKGPEPCKGPLVEPGSVVSDHVPQLRVESHRSDPRFVGDSGGSLLNWFCHLWALGTESPSVVPGHWWGLSFIESALCSSPDRPLGFTDALEIVHIIFCVWGGRRIHLFHQIPKGVLGLQGI